MAGLLKEIEFRTRRSAERLFGRPMGLGDVKRLLEVAEFKPGKELDYPTAPFFDDFSFAVMPVITRLEESTGTVGLENINFGTVKEVIGTSKLGWRDYQWIVRVTETSSADFSNWAGLVVFRGKGEPGFLDFAVGRRRDYCHLTLATQSHAGSVPGIIEKKWVQAGRLGVKWEPGFAEKLSVAAGFKDTEWIPSYLLGPLAQYLRLNVR